VLGGGRQLEVELRRLQSVARRMHGRTAVLLCCVLRCGAEHEHGAEHRDQNAIGAGGRERLGVHRTSLDFACSAVHLEL
jgi:hypothetical protein